MTVTIYFLDFLKLGTVDQRGIVLYNAIVNVKLRMHNLRTV